MTHATLFTLLQTLGLPVAHNDYKDPPFLPYLIYKESGASATGSDERNEIRNSEWLVELYTEKKDVGTQTDLEGLLNSRGVEWDMAFGGTIDSEGLYMAAYTFKTKTKIRRV